MVSRDVGALSHVVGGGVDFERGDGTGDQASALRAVEQIKFEK